MSKRSWHRRRPGAGRWVTWAVLCIGAAAVVVTVLTHRGIPVAHRHPASTRDQSAPIPSGPSKTLVSLGDSITFGEHLKGAVIGSGPALTGTPSEQAYPFVVGRKKDWHVVDLGVPGDTSSDLLDALKQKRFRAALRKANVVTLDIGSNDLVHAAYGIVERMLSDPASVDTQSENQAFRTALAGFSQNLPEVIASIRQQTNAPVVIMTLYDPFPDGTSLHDITEPFLAEANGTILQEAAQEHFPVADVYAVMNHHQQLLVRKDDIHPTAQGQTTIARAVEAVLSSPVSFVPQEWAVIPAHAQVFREPSVLSPPVAGGSEQRMGLIDSEQGGWLKVQLGDKAAGYVDASQVTRVIRPWPVGPQSTIAADVALGSFRGPLGATALLGFRFNGEAYAPASGLAQLAGATASWQPETRTVSISTRDHSGIMDRGQARRRLSFAPLATNSRLHLSSQEEGALLRIDGEPIRLASPVLIVDGTAYLPAEAVWQALGGS